MAAGEGSVVGPAVDRERGNVDAGVGSVKSGSEGGAGSLLAGGASSNDVGGVRAGVMPVATAYSEMCRRVADFAVDYPAYPTFVDSLLDMTCSGTDGDRMDSREREGVVDAFASCSTEEGLISSAGPVRTAGADLGDRAGAAAGASTTTTATRIDTALNGNQRQRYQWRQWQQGLKREGATVASDISASSVATTTSTATVASNGRAPADTAAAATAADTSTRYGSGENGDTEMVSASSVDGRKLSAPSSPSPALVNELAVIGEKALGAAMTAAAKESGGEAAATMLLLSRARRDHC